MEFYPITETPQPIVRRMFGCSLYPSQSLTDQGLNFSPSLGDTIQLQGQANPTLSIALPGALSDVVAPNVAPNFCAYKTESLFIRRETYLVTSGRDTLVISSGVVSARLSLGVRVSNLVEPVRMSFKKSNVSKTKFCLSLMHAPCVSSYRRMVARHCVPIGISS